MSGGAIIGAAAIGAVSSYASASSASSSAEAALASADANAALQYDLGVQNLEFQQGIYADWEATFGPIQQTLSNYYQNLSADTVASLGIQSIEQEYSKSRTALDTALAKRGITNSGATVAGLTQLESAKMLGRAEVQATAPQQVAQQQMSFLSAGLGLQPSVTSGVSSAYSGMINTMGQQYASNTALAGNYAAQASQAYSGIGTSIGSGISSYLTYNALNPTTTASTYTPYTDGWSSSVYR